MIIAIGQMFIGGNGGSIPTPPSGDWILATGLWDDGGVWEDSNVWID